MGNGKIFFFHDGVKGQPHQSNESCAIASETEVAEQRLPPVQMIGHLFFVVGVRKETAAESLEASFSKMDLRLGEALTNQKGGKCLPTEPPLRWSTTQWAEILYEPSSFGKSEFERVSLALELTAEMEKTVERLEKQASSLVAGKKLEAQLQFCIKQTRSGQSLKLKANMSKVRFWDADGNKLASPPAELRGCKALVAVEVRQL